MLVPRRVTVGILCIFPFAARVFFSTKRLSSIEVDKLGSTNCELSLWKDSIFNQLGVDSLCHVLAQFTH